MNALFEVEPVVLSGTTGNDHRYTQFWQESSYLGTMRWLCVAEAGASIGEGPFLKITAGCPEGWRRDAFRAFHLLDDGLLYPATHTVAWTFGKPTFTEVAK